MLTDRKEQPNCWLQKGKMKTLIVDDDRPLAELFAFVLQTYGINSASFAGDGAQALMFLEENPDTALIITDREMPNMDGLELIKKCRDKYPKIKIILTTGTASSKDDLDVFAKETGANAVIPKPFRASEIQNALKKIAS